MASPEKSKVRTTAGPKIQLYHHRVQPKSPHDLQKPGLPILQLAGRSSPRYQFWLLCTVMFFLVFVYGFVFWDSMTQSPHYRVQGNAWEQMRRKYDIHVDNWQAEDNDGSYDEGLISHEHERGRTKTNTVAIGCAVTLRAYNDLTVDNIQYRLPLLRTLLPSFCNTASAGYSYHFYVSFDVDDMHLHQADFLNAIHEHFRRVTGTLCPKGANATLHFVQCSHSRNPAWAQNDAMMEAYLDDAEYYYRVNDDTLMLSPGWTESYVEALHGFDPPLVGVVGPMHKGGNEFILAYDFVHKTHIDIFGYYYPRLFTDWWADDWMTAVYGSDRTLKLPGVKLKHTQEAGQRYKVQYNNGELVHYQVAYDRKTLNRFIYSKMNGIADKERQPSNTKRVISMSLWGNDPKYTFGAIRNAQLVPVYFPGWTLRVYVEEPHENRPPRYQLTPRRVVSKLGSLGAEIVYVDTDEVSTAPMLWRFLVADDLSVECFIVRDADGRLQDRDAAAVEDWLRSGSPFHCMRDHPSHAAYSLSGGMWGARPRELRKVIPISWKNLMLGYRNQYGSDMNFLSALVWRKVEPVAYCHDSYSCKKWKNSRPFPVRRRGSEHVGQVFDAFGYARDIDMKIIRETPSPVECVAQNATYAGPKLQTDLMDAEVVNSAQLKQLEEDIEKRKSQHRLEMALKDSLLVRKEGENVERDTGSSSGERKNTSMVLDALPEEERNAIGHRFANNGSHQYVVWNMDYHISSIRDIKYLLRSHDDVLFIDKSLSAKCHLTRTCATNLKVITKKNGMLLTEEVKKAFFQEYQDDPEMNLVTHFLCTYPPAMCELYLPFHKPIILYITGRYEHGRYTRKQWESWNQVLRGIAKERRNVVIASNLYDAAYLEYYTGLRPPVIPPVCSYVQTHYSPVRPEILIAPVHNPSFYELFSGYMASIIKRNRDSISVLYIPEAYPEYAFSDIASHPAVVHIPYQVSTYTFCEHYAMNIPIFVPSLHLLANWHQKYDVISQLTWNRIRGLLGDTRSIRVYNTNVTNPNSLHEVADIKEWLKLADFYHRPHIIYFDSVRDLVEKLTTTDFRRVSESMKHYNDNIGPLMEQKWSAVFQY